ncbi:hypothetical protein NPIL_599451 [Nephila pilipes]|uniref:Uncharacterized protein n=1 Tax=Nephila pilipes TaxID=299642 RepID=A0A8X6PS98_NEPPI|nr:hypothetical protein NPIL_599451 [Nephila pilipes]
MLRKLDNSLIRHPNNSFWRDCDFGRARNLKTQKEFIQCIHNKAQYKIINEDPYELLFCAGASVFRHSFSFYLHVGTFTNQFDRELEAIHVALQQLAVHLDTFERAVIFSDSGLCPSGSVQQPGKFPCTEMQGSPAEI